MTECYIAYRLFERAAMEASGMYEHGLEKPYHTRQILKTIESAIAIQKQATDSLLGMVNGLRAFEGSLSRKSLPSELVDRIRK